LTKKSKLVKTHLPHSRILFAFTAFFAWAILSAKPAPIDAEKQERHFSAGQVFDYKQPILFGV
jgi:hypothetical protein